MKTMMTALMFLLPGLAQAKVYEISCEQMVATRVYAGHENFVMKIDPSTKQASFLHTRTITSSANSQIPLGTAVLHSQEPQLLYGFNASVGDHVSISYSYLGGFPRVASTLVQFEADKVLNFPTTLSLKKLEINWKPVMTGPLARCSTK